VFRIRTGWSLTKASWKVLKADRSLVVFPAVALWVAWFGAMVVMMVGVGVAGAVNVPVVVIPFLLAGVYFAIFSIVYFNVALAGAAQLSIDGRDTTFRDGLAAARKRRGVIAQWALLQFGLGLLISVIGSLLGGGNGRPSPAASLLTTIAGFAWSVASFFVIPVLALEGLGPRAALHRSVGLVREHWGESIVGRTGITGIIVLIALVPVVACSLATDALSSTNPAGAAAGSALLCLVVLTALALGTALSVIFKVEMYRYATSGKLTGTFDQQTVESVFRKG
jgi:Family of unknown function (DUF6159)